MGRRLWAGVHVRKDVSVSALSDHLMGHSSGQFVAGNAGVSVSALSDHLMGPPAI